MDKRSARFKMHYFSALYDNVFSALMPPPREKTQPFLFIAGSGRNGSTLLSCILNNHPRICIPPEHSLIPAAIIYWYTHPWLSWTGKAEHICALLEKPSQWKLDVAALKKYLLSTRDQKRGIDQVLRSVYGIYAGSQGKMDVIPGDKTPANTLYIKLIKKQFPSAKIIFLVRDPRDVMASHLQANKEYYSDRFEFMVWRWKNSIDKYLSLAKLFPQDVLLLKYEDLARQPQSKINDVLQFLELEPVTGLFNIDANSLEFAGVKDAAHHQNILNPVSAASIGKWEQYLPKGSSAMISNKLGMYMKMFGY